MRIIRSTLMVVVVCAVAAAAQAPAQRPGGNQPPAGPGGPGGPGAQGGRRGPVQIMTLTTTAWTDGGTIPRKHTQAGEEVSPPLSWSNVPEGTGTFVLVARDLDAALGSGTDDTLHWLLWNIPASVTSLAEGLSHGSQLPDGTRQISASGPYYRGPGAPASGPAHHYAFELYAVDGPINVQAVGQSPADTRAAVLTAMSGRVRGKGVLIGLFKR